MRRVGGGSKRGRCNGLFFTRVGDMVQGSQPQVHTSVGPEGQCATADGPPVGENKLQLNLLELNAYPKGSQQSSCESAIARNETVYDDFSVRTEKQG